jgi:hypothetical protein
MRPLHAVLLVVAFLGLVGVVMGSAHARYQRSLPAHAPQRPFQGSGPIDT